MRIACDACSASAMALDVCRVSSAQSDGAAQNMTRQAGSRIWDTTLAMSRERASSASATAPIQSWIAGAKVIIPIVDRVAHAGSLLADDVIEP